MPIAVPVGAFRRRIAGRPGLLRPGPGGHPWRHFDSQRGPVRKKGHRLLEARLLGGRHISGQGADRVQGQHDDPVRAVPITGLANLAILQSWVWQLGGEFYNSGTGKWNFSTAEGKAAAQALYDLYWTDKVASFDLANDNNETTQFQRGLVSSNLNGMWQISSIEETVPGFSADAIVTPFLTGYTTQVRDPD